MTGARRPWGEVPGHEFNAVLGLGGGGGAVHPVDGVGAALAAIQGLHERLQEQQAEIARLRTEVQAVEELQHGIE